MNHFGWWIGLVILVALLWWLHGVPQPGYMAHYVDVVAIWNFCLIMTVFYVAVGLLMLIA